MNALRTIFGVTMWLAVAAGTAGSRLVGQT